MLLRSLTNDRESDVLLPLCNGKTAEIGCGYRKVHPNNIGVDMCGPGELGKAGNVKGKASVADHKALGDDLWMFKTGELDAMVAKHVLEHFDDPMKTLLEWKRVVRKGGKIGVIVPNDKYVDTMTLDPTHKQRFTHVSLIRLFTDAGLKVLDGGDCIRHWSLYIIAEKR